MFSPAFVCSQGGCLPLHTMPDHGEVCLLRGVYFLEVCIEVGGTHPTRMYTCFYQRFVGLLIPVFLMECTRLHKRRNNLSSNQPNDIKQFYQSHMPLVRMDLIDIFEFSLNIFTECCDKNIYHCSKRV